MAMLADTQTNEKSRCRNEPNVSLARPLSAVLLTNRANCSNPLWQNGGDYSIASLCAVCVIQSGWLFTSFWIPAFAGMTIKKLE